LFEIFVFYNFYNAFISKFWTWNVYGFKLHLLICAPEIPARTVRKMSWKNRRFNRKSLMWRAFNLQEFNFQCSGIFCASNQLMPIEYLFDFLSVRGFPLYFYFLCHMKNLSPISLIFCYSLLILPPSWFLTLLIWFPLCPRQVGRGI
jgi:hypothetical protein